VRRNEEPEPLIGTDEEEMKASGRWKGRKSSSRSSGRRGMEKMEREVREQERVSGEW